MRKAWPWIKERLRRRGWLVLELILAFLSARWSAGYSISDHQYWAGLGVFVVMMMLIWGDGHEKGVEEGRAKQVAEVMKEGKHED